MLKRSITYENPFTESEVTEEHYFHISKADLVEMEMEENKAVYTDRNGNKLTGMQAKLTRIVEAEDGKAIMQEFKEMIRRSYGRKDGDRFLKSPHIWADFESSAAFSQLLFELCTDAGAAADFINGILPKNLESVAAEVQARAPQTTTPEGRQAQIDANAETLRERGIESLNMSEPRVLTVAEVQAMDAAELQSGLASGRYKLS